MRKKGFVRDATALSPFAIQNVSFLSSTCCLQQGGSGVGVLQMGGGGAGAALLPSQEGGGVTVPKGVQGTRRCGTEGCSSMVGMSWGWTR